MPGEFVNEMVTTISFLFWLALCFLVAPKGALHESVGYGNERGSAGKFAATVF